MRKLEVIEWFFASNAKFGSKQPTNSVGFTSELCFFLCCVVFQAKVWPIKKMQVKNTQELHLPHSLFIRINKEHHGQRAGSYPEQQSLVGAP